MHVATSSNAQQVYQTYAKFGRILKKLRNFHRAGKKNNFTNVNLGIRNNYY